MVGAVFLDLSRAFDTINHATLVEKLTLYGVRAKRLDWSCTTGSSLWRLTVLEEMKNQFTSGVPQGSIMGPLLFLLFFDTIADCLYNSQIIMYADDTVLYFSDKDVNNINNCINKDMELISNYCYHNGIITYPEYEEGENRVYASWNCSATEGKRDGDKISR